MNSSKFDDLITDGSPYAAIVMTQELEPVHGKGSVIFPPTYAQPQGLNQRQREEWVGYDISVSSDGTSKTCMLDSVGSQSNRMEGSFTQNKYSNLVPQVTIKIKGGNGKKEDINLLNVSHRSADALVRYSSIRTEIHEAFESAAEKNYTPIAKLNPTALVFGVWDSRVSRVKIPRIVTSEVRAYNIDVHTRSATYVPPVDYIGTGVFDESELTPKIKDNMSGAGFRHIPASQSHGGITAKKIDRKVILNLAQIRILQADTEENTMALRRYILGLSLVAATSKGDTMFNLRQGCLLKESSATKWNVESSYYEAPPFEISSEDIAQMHTMSIDYATKVSEEFEVGENRSDEEFDNEYTLNEVKNYKKTEE